MAGKYCFLLHNAALLIIAEQKVPPQRPRLLQRREAGLGRLER